MSLQPWRRKNPKPEQEPEVDDSERDELIAMRYLFLYQSGMPAETAAVIAQKLEVDWHQAVDLLDQGCEPDLIVEILT